MTEKRYIYWKVERAESPWNLIQDTPEARKRAVDSGAMFFTWASLSAPYTDNGPPEPHRWGDFPLDFDSKDNIQAALDDVVNLCLLHLPQIYGIEPYDFQFYLSGGKGFHVMVPADILGASKGDPQLPLIYKRMAVRWKESLKLASLDLSLYCMKRGKMLRLPNIRRANGKYKVPLYAEEVMRADAADLMALADKPRELEIF